MIFDNDYAPLAIVDTEGRYSHVNATWQKNTGLSRRQVLGRFPEEFFMNSGFAAVVKSKEPILCYETQNRLRGFKSYCNYYPLFDVAGQFCGAMVWTFIRDFELTQEFAKKLDTISQRLNHTTAKLQRLESSTYSIDSIIGSSQAVIKLKEAVRVAARTNSNVLIEGETGTGKELVAHAIHRLSARGNQRMVRVNCSAIPATLLESEFFGYAPGAYTGAQKNGKPGLFELASKGSIFLDEVNQLPLFVQPKLLRVLQEHEVTRVGGIDTIAVSPRVITATNIPLYNLVAGNRFRNDLYYRLNVVRIQLPPLRERKEDLYDLVPHLVKQLNAQIGVSVSYVEEGVIPFLSGYNWPGNIRELQNAIEAAMNNCMEDTLCISHFMDFSTAAEVVDCSREQPLRQKHLTKEAIFAAIEQCGGNRARAARQLGISRATLYNKLK